MELAKKDSQSDLRRHLISKSKGYVRSSAATTMEEMASKSIESFNTFW